MEYILGVILEMLWKEDSKTVRLTVQPLTHWPPDVIAWVVFCHLLVYSI
jgi:hypothetical protein